MVEDGSHSGDLHLSRSADGQLAMSRELNSQRDIQEPRVVSNCGQRLLVGEYLTSRAISPSREAWQKPVSQAF